MNPHVIVEWLEPVTEQFFITKGLLGLLGTILLIVHMSKTWSDLPTLGRRMRYYALLLAAFVVTTGSYEQVLDGAEVNWRNVGGMALTVVIVIAAIISIVEDTRSKPARRA